MYSSASGSDGKNSACNAGDLGLIAEPEGSLERRCSPSASYYRREPGLRATEQVSDGSKSSRSKAELSYLFQWDWKKNAC